LGPPKKDDLKKRTSLIGRRLPKSGEADGKSDDIHVTDLTLTAIERVKRDESKDEKEMDRWGSNPKGIETSNWIDRDGERGFGTRKPVPKTSARPLFFNLIIIIKGSYPPALDKRSIPIQLSCTIPLTSSPPYHSNRSGPTYNYFGEEYPAMSIVTRHAILI
jgi:hypothetical protein